MSVHVTSWVLRHSDATLGDRLVLLVLADHANEDGTSAWPSVETIANQARLSERQARRCLRALEDAGEIRETGKSKKGTHVYELPRYIEWGDNMSAPRGDIRDVEGGTSTTDGGGHPDPRSVLTTPTQLHPSSTTSTEVSVVSSNGKVFDPLKGAKVDGRNLPWDALVAETEEHGEANTVRVGRALKAIRKDAWKQISDGVDGALDFVQGEWERYETELANEITRRVRWLKAEKPDLTWGAEGVARWWTRVPAGGEDTRLARTELLVQEGLRRAAERRGS